MRCLLAWRNRAYLSIVRPHARHNFASYVHSPQFDTKPANKYRINHGWLQYGTIVCTFRPLPSSDYRKLVLRRSWYEAAKSTRNERSNRNHCSLFERAHFAEDERQDPICSTINAFHQGRAHIVPLQYASCCPVAVTVKMGYQVGPRGGNVLILNCESEPLTSLCLYVAGSTLGLKVDLVFR